MEYSIWIVPPEPIYSQLKETIDKLAQSYGGPRFEPHMTLLGNINKSLPEIEKAMKNLAGNSKSLDLSLGLVSFSTTYFQSVFVRVNSTAHLMQLNLEAKKLFGMENNVFMPHISLLYGDHSMDIRESVALALKLPHVSFTVNEFVITPATTDPGEWEHSITIPFS